MYRIGDFSKLSGISVRTLRYYDEIGLLEPNYIDNFTNYRYYDDENLDSLNYILYLKRLGFSLEEIINNKDSMNGNIIDDKIEELLSVKENLEEQIFELYNFRESLDNSIITVNQKLNDKVLIKTAK